ncbi:YhjD/YihY/BrkB family envelope integrity protein [Cutibacterium sp.]|uniref:YhjD/YihY/BrkB family envelope integrity protein n=1 Tax=Cutibacterium sp. TaxID=1912221 RepID=UPI0026DAAC4A|nr:YhjD/YihY/BrkB family envelope integrity protein [Cutibacterium sp.]MDO4411901.1 YhjD/YihY/BrkB family envelope integrity protein [Cutibacterium sp.]
MKRPGIAHLLRAHTRFTRRLGNHFAASITYFTMLAIVPVIAFAFAMLGLVLSRLSPYLLNQVVDSVVDLATQQADKDHIRGIIENAMKVGGSIWAFIVSILTALWAGIGWVGNIRKGIQAEWAPDFDMVADDRGFLRAKLSDMLAFLGLLLVSLLTIITSQVGSSMAGLLARWTGLDTVPGHGLLLTLAGLLATTISGWLLFIFLYTVMPHGKPVWRPILKGSVVAGLALALLQVGAGYLVQAFSSNKAVQAFGSVIIIMLVFDLVARLILFIASWIATANQPAVAKEWNACDEPLLGSDDCRTVDGHWEAALVDRARKQAEKDEKDGKEVPQQVGRYRVVEGAPRQVDDEEGTPARGVADLMSATLTGHQNTQLPGVVHRAPEPQRDTRIIQRTIHFVVTAGLAVGAFFLGRRQG